MLASRVRRSDFGGSTGFTRPIVDDNLVLFPQYEKNCVSAEIDRPREAVAGTS